MKFLLLLLLAVGLLALGASAWAADATTVLIAGDPPLTEGMSERLTGFIEWVMEAPLTAQQGTDLRATMLDSWQRNDHDEIAGLLEMLKMDEQVRALAAADREFALSQIQPALLTELRKQPDDEASRWLLGIYDSAHTPIAAGDPPLIRQVTDAYAEALFFMVSEVLGTELELTAEFKESFAKFLAAEYPQCDAAGKAQLAQMPSYWAAIRVIWPTLNAEEQEGYRQQWADGVRKLAGPPAPAAPAAEGTAKLEGQSAAAYAQRAAQYLANAVYDEAIADCNRAIELDPKCAVAYATRGQAYSDWQHDAKRCMADCTRAIELDPNCWIAYQYRGVALCTEGDDQAGDADWAMMRAIKRTLGLEAPAQAGGDTAADKLREYQRHQETMRWANEMGRMSHESNMAIIHNIGDGWRYENRY